VVKEIFPLLILTLLINLIDSSMWTIGPLLASTLPDGVFAGGVFMFAYTLPPLFVGYLVGEGLKRFGKKYFASVFLALGAFFSLFIGVISTPVLLVGITFIMSLAVSLAWPAVNALYADYIGTRKSVEDAVESTDDFFTNIGDVLGPMCAGALADMIGLPYAFSAIGGIVLVSLVFLYVGKYSISMLLRRNG
jgi:MFS family permease